jgi:hypothetical protein
MVHWWMLVQCGQVKIHKYFHFILDFHFGLSLLIDSSQIATLFQHEIALQSIFFI